MSAKTSAEVIINGKVYTLSGYEGQEYFQKVASYINEKINEFESLENTKHLPREMKSTLVQINIADDYFKAKAQVEKLERDMELKDRELYDLKHDLISNQLKTESADDRIKELEAENRELLSVKEILELYPNLSEGAIREAINNRGLKFIQMGKKTGKGGKCLIDRKDLEEFLDKQKQTQVPIKPPVENSKQININAILNKAG